MRWLTLRSLPLVLALLIVTAACAKPAVNDLEVVDLVGVDQLAATFNQAGSDGPRLLLLLSPTWTVCQAGARAVLSDILQKNPLESVAVFAVWFAVLGPDSSSQVDTSLLDDPRAIHYWDSEGEVSAFLTEHANQLGLPEDGLFWDAYLLFGPGAEWEDVPSRLVGWGAPVVTTIDELTTQLDDVWASN